MSEGRWARRAPEEAGDVAGDGRPPLQGKGLWWQVCGWAGLRDGPSRPHPTPAVGPAVEQPGRGFVRRSGQWWGREPRGLAEASREAAGAGQPQGRVLGGQGGKKRGPHQDGWSPLPRWGTSGVRCPRAGAEETPGTDGVRSGWGRRNDRLGPPCTLPSTQTAARTELTAPSEGLRVGPDAGGAGITARGYGGGKAVLPPEPGWGGPDRSLWQG